MSVGRMIALAVIVIALVLIVLALSGVGSTFSAVLALALIAALGVAIVVG